MYIEADLLDPNNTNSIISYFDKNDVLIFELSEN
jgi:hypothetical protein